MSLRINFRIAKMGAKAAKKPSNTSGFYDVFEPFMTDDGSLLYLIKSVMLPLPSPDLVRNGKLIAMPIPPGFQTAAGVPITIPSEVKNTKLFPLIVSLEDKPASGDSEEHFCDASPTPSLDEGTSCAETMTSLTYFKTTTPVPPIKGNDFLKAYVEEYNKRNKGKTLYYLMTLSPNNTVQYVVFNDEKDLDKLLVQCRKSIEENKRYYLGLNGFLIYVDQWDCTVFLANYASDNITIGGKAIQVPSKVHFHVQKTAQSK